MNEILDLDQLLLRIREEARRGAVPAAPLPVDIGLLEQQVQRLAVPVVSSLGDYFLGDEVTFLRQAYFNLLGRAPDPDGLGHFLAALQQGSHSRMDVLHELAGSPEGLQKNARVPEAEPVRWSDKLFAWRDRSGERLYGQMQQRNQAQAEVLQGLLQHLASAQQVLRAAEGRIHATEQRAQEDREAALKLRQDLMLHQHALRRLVQGAVPPAPEVACAHADDALHAYYLAFEHAYRGSEDAIAVAQSAYLPDVRGSAAQRLPLLDIGCGRGEWLALLREHGFQVRGIDLNPAMVDSCRGRGLDVVAQDALAYLRQQPDNSLGAITGFHVVEHIPFAQVFDLVGEALRVLAPGGKLILETPNPENVVVGASAFYNDPTHLNPLPPRPLEFLARYHGFDPVEIRRLHPYPMEQYLKGEGEVVNFLNYHFHGPQDYALLATKGGQ